MPPSTVFSYWRREHRRSSAPPISSSSAQAGLRAKSTSNLPQLPVIQHTPVLATTIEESSSLPNAPSPLTSNQYWPADLDTDKGNAAIFTVPIHASSSPSANLAVPSFTSDKHAGPQSCPEERDRTNPDLTSQSNLSQVSLTAPRPDYGDSDSSKPSSPFRLSFGKGLLNAHNQSSDANIKRSTTPVLTSTAEKSNAMQKEYRLEGANSRRQERDSSGEHTTHKSGKTRLHLLNPMALLARRRSSQIAGPRAEDISIRTRNVVPAIPDDYDPRIRGSIVHDFSAPRPRRNLSAAPVLQQYTSPDSLQNGNDTRVQTSEHRRKHSEYSPVFKEHFEDDPNLLQVNRKAYLQSSLLTNTSLHGDERSVPVFARRLPSRLPDFDEHPNEQVYPLPEQAPPLSQPQAEAPVEVPPEAPRDTDTIEIIPHQPSGLPKHFKSNASRFSFDMNGVESSAQEKLLEEKHKEKEAARRAQARLEDREYSDVDDDYDNELLDDLDDLEEKIPGVNVDAEEDEFSGFSGPGAALTSSWYAPGLSPVAASPITAPGFSPVVDPDSQVDHGLVPGLPVNPSPPIDNSRVFPLPGGSTVEDDIEDQIACLSQAAIQQASAAVGYSMPADAQPTTSQSTQEDDDLYFDDGEFGDLSADVGGEKFDESIFDDETSHLYARRTIADPIAPAPLNMKGEQAGPDEALSRSNTLCLKVSQNDGLKHVPSVANEVRDITSMKHGGHVETAPNLATTKSHGGVLSEHNLEALHNALEKAANDSASVERFGRTTSSSESSLGQDSLSQTTQTMDSYSGLVSDDSHLTQAIDVLGFEEVFDDFNYDDDDAAFYDDPIIAAANAEALENDDEGFYGQEFGFYAQAHGTCSSELTNGGYFGPRGVEGVSRSHSSRGKFREPSLTPITERSEWSTRNSVISLAAHGTSLSNPSLSNPGLAQLVDMGNLDDEMSLSALLRLRRGAWGGSNGSLRSGSGSPPPHPNPSSNRGSFTGFSDVSPSVQTVPPDYLFGGPSAVDSPIREVGESGSRPVADETGGG